MSLATTDSTATTSTTAYGCGLHALVLVSLRGSNRNQRVETAECRVCEQRFRRVLLGPTERVSWRRIDA